MPYIIVAIVLCVLPASLRAADRPCAACGCQSRCHKVCRVVCEMKEVKTVCYDCRCEDFCVPGRSCKIGEICECDPCHTGAGCKCLDGFFGRCAGETCRNVWQPSCEATVHTRKKLYKREVAKKVPSYKWVVEYCCPECCAKVPTTKEAALAALPPDDGASAETVPEPPAAIAPVQHTAPVGARAKLPWERLLK